MKAMRLFRSRMFLAAIGLVALYFLIWLCGYWIVMSGYAWDSHRVKESIRRGDEIVAALKQFKNDHGDYPEKLEQLVPQYLEAIPPPVAGENYWKYDRGEPPHGAILYFSTPDDYPIGYYYLKNGEWRIDS